MDVGLLILYQSRVFDAGGRAPGTTEYLRAAFDAFANQVHCHTRNSKECVSSFLITSLLPRVYPGGQNKTLLKGFVWLEGRAARSVYSVRLGRLVWAGGRVLHPADYLRASFNAMIVCFNLMCFNLIDFLQSNLLHSMIFTSSIQKSCSQLHFHK